MRDGSLSYRRFCAEADLLQKRSHEIASKQQVGSGKGVATWEWKHGNRQHLDGDSYLVSTGNARQYHSNRDTDIAETIIELDGDIDELLQDNWTSVDEAQTMVQQSRNVETALLEFHIVYHTIYQTPVLYFRVQAVDGTPVNSNIVTRDLQFPGSNGRSTFVAMEEHPVLGKPFSCLHPCETATAMQLLLAQLQARSTEASSYTNVPQYLVSWLSLVQPLTEISPLDYYSV
ncbi:Autophagocytosis associated protein active-site domain-containing protein [Phytophthora infestans]|uniref:Ubiquitin-like-conjugating enzyme ATG10 n=1 Tax=Phytophthora infestans TaxID=4787 RepID=A0A8S9UZR2_PHYIN|nr:Autophagocytosis associated protein active-site domain-containing protein [Phytophthora infestans]